MQRKSAVDLANYIIVMLRKANECPFTMEELAEAAAELDEEATEWVAYCTTCKAAVQTSYDRRFVDAAALIHAIRRTDHQVIVGKEILGRSYGVSIEP